MSKRGSIRAATDLYEGFREEAPRKIRHVEFDVPRAVAVIGYLEAVEYKTTHGRKVTLYRHEFAPGSRPLLAVSANGKQLLLLGGRYKFDERGIVDRDAQGRPILDPKHRQFINPRGGKFDRCVKKVKAQGSAVNAYAVCTAAGVKRNPKKPKVRDPEHKALLSDLAAHFAKDEAAGASRAMRGYLVQRTTDGMFAISKDGFHIATAKTPAHAEEIIGYLA